MTTTNTTATVETYQLTTRNGRPIRKATLVRFADGAEVRFIEKLTKREAIPAAIEVLAKRAAVGA